MCKVRRVRITRGAAQTRADQPLRDREILAASISSLEYNPYPDGLRHIPGQPDNRFAYRIGEYRVTFIDNVETATIHVLAIWKKVDEVLTFLTEDSNK